MLKEPRRRVRFLRREEADRLVEALPEHMKPIVRFALATGCRAGEILGLEWNRVDLVRKVAWLDHRTTKSGEGRGIPRTFTTAFQCPDSSALARQFFKYLTSDPRR